jgi:transcriptional regulator with XRE-family HTH domain
MHQTRRDIRDRAKRYDEALGRAIRRRRIELGLSQGQIARHLHVTFQQVQKYEKGVNRIGASRLQEISRILDVPVSFFFEDVRQEADPDPNPDPGHRIDGHALGFAEEPVARFEVSAPASEAQALARAFSQIGDARIRRRIIDLVETLADAHRP